MSHILGIDVGKASFMVAFPPHPDTDPKHWETVQIAYSDAYWYRELLRLAEPGATVALEPTGWHYMNPIAEVLAEVDALQLWHVNHKTTKAVRETYISSAKNDRLDAKTLALIARMIRDGRPPRGARHYNAALEIASQRLRLLVNTHRRCTKMQTRLLNQLDALGHAIWPELAIGKETWLNAIRQANLITPAEIHAFLLKDAFDHPIYADGRSRRPLQNLCSRMPPVECDPILKEAVRELSNQLHNLRVEIAENEAKIDLIIHGDPFQAVTAKWETIPGAGCLWIGALHVASRAQAHLFTGDEFKAAVGVNPRTHQSGSEDQTKRPKSGYRPAMDAMYLWTMQLIKPQNMPNPIGTYFERTRALKAFSATKRKFGDVLSGIARNPHGTWEDAR